MRKFGRITSSASRLMLILLVFLAFGRYAHGGECKAPDGEEIARVIKYEAKVNHLSLIHIYAIAAARGEATRTHHGRSRQGMV